MKKIFVKSNILFLIIKDMIICDRNALRCTSKWINRALKKTVAQNKKNHPYLAKNICKCCNRYTLKVRYCIRTGYKNLAYYARKGRLNSIRYLFEKDESFISKRDDLNEALYFAVLDNHFNVAEYLLNKGASSYFNENCLIQAAADNNNFKMVRLLLSNGADITANDNYAVRIAVKNNNTKMVRCLLRHGARVDGEGMTPIVDAINKNNIEMAQLLVYNGANIHVKDSFAIKTAADKNSTEMVRLLINHGALVFAGDDYAFKKAVSNRNADMMHLLLKAGASKTNLGDALVRAVDFNDTNMVKVLWYHGVKLSSNNNYAIKKAFDNNNVEMIRFLVLNGADIGFALDLAIANRKDDLIDFIKKRKKVGRNWTNEILRCAMIPSQYGIRRAAHEGHMDVITFLMSLPKKENN